MGDDVKAWRDRRLTLLLDYRDALRQRVQEYESLDVEALGENLREAGWTVDIRTFEDVANSGELPGECIIHYTSSQEPGYRRFVDDLLFELSRSNDLVPRYEIFRAHEDKLYQELLRRRLGLAPLAARLFGNLKGLTGHIDDLAYPAVLKTAAGFQSTGVSLVSDADALRRRVRRLNRPPGLAIYSLKQWLKRWILRGRYRPEQYEDCVYGGPFVVQQYVPGATNDWKVLVFGDRCWVLRRGVRQGDFRASGSGMFSWKTPPDAVLDLASDTFARLDVPLVSLDIVAARGKCRLIEYQALHFGTYTLDHAPGHFRRGPAGWRHHEGSADLDQEYARALLLWLEKHRQENTA